MFSECLCIRESMHLCMGLEQTLLARYIWLALIEFDQTFTADGLWGKDEHVKFWGQQVKGLGYDWVKYAPECTSWPCSWRRHSSRQSRNHYLVVGIIGYHPDPLPSGDSICIKFFLH